MKRGKIRAGTAGLERFKPPREVLGVGGYFSTPPLFYFSLLTQVVREGFI